MMRVRGSVFTRTLAAAALVGCAAWLTGCGSGSSGGTVSGTQITGTVEAPDTQVARTPSWDLRAVARVFTIGSPVDADVAISRRPVRGGTVVLAQMSNQVELARTTTGDDGGFVFTGVTPGTTFTITVTAQGARGPITLRGVVQTGAQGQASAAVNEATTVGTEAALLVLGEGASETAALAVAGQIAAAQEAAQRQSPTATPDLADATQVREQAGEQLTAVFNNVMTTIASTPAGQTQAQTALAAAQALVFARTQMGLDPSIRLNSAQSAALAGVAKNFTAAEVATALNTAGVNSGVVTEQDVTAALAALKARQGLDTAIASVPADAIPPVVALLLALQANDTTVAFRISQQEQLNAFLSALVGTQVPASGQPESVPAGGGTSVPDTGGAPVTDTPVPDTGGAPVTGTVPPTVTVPGSGGVSGQLPVTAPVPAGAPA